MNSFSFKKLFLGLSMLLMNNTEARERTQSTNVALSFSHKRVYELTKFTLL